VIAAAQQAPCKVDLPVIVTLPDYGLVRQLGPTAFSAQHKGRPIAIQSVETRQGPRRILFVVETGKQVPEIARATEIAVISQIIAKAPPGDSFALMTTRGPQHQIPFGTDREAISTVLGKIKTESPGQAQKGGVLDTLMEATTQFRSHQEGDAIVALTMGIESEHKAGYKKVRDSILKSHLRLFGLQLGPIDIGSYSSGPHIVDPANSYIVSASILPNRENLFALTRETGGFAAWEDMESGPRKRQRLTDERLLAVKHMGLQLYRAVAEYYSIQLETPPNDFVLNLADSVRKDLAQARVSYPIAFSECHGAP
jgi:hypothetical protein